MCRLLAYWGPPCPSLELLVDARALAAGAVHAPLASRPAATRTPTAGAWPGTPSATGADATTSSPPLPIGRPHARRPERPGRSWPSSAGRAVRGPRPAQVAGFAHRGGRQRAVRAAAAGCSPTTASWPATATGDANSCGPTSARRRRASIESDADSEVLFGLVLDRLAAGDDLARPWPRGRRRSPSRGSAPADDPRPGDRRWASTTWCSPTAGSWWPPDGATACTCAATCPAPGAVIVASEPYDDDADWQERARPHAGARRRRPPSARPARPDSRWRSIREPSRPTRTTDPDGGAVRPHRRADGSATTCEDALRADVRRGLTATPKELPPKWFYDDRGCELFDAITRLARVLPDRARARRSCGPRPRPSWPCPRPTRWSSWVRARRTRPGCCSTPWPTPASCAASCPSRSARPRCGPRPTPSAPSTPASRSTPWSATSSATWASCPAAVGAWSPSWAAPSATSRRPSASASWPTWPTGMAPGDRFLLGTDLVKDVARLEAAYDDAAGVTAEFNLNVLAVVNRELGADFDLDQFAHVARFDPDEEWIEMRLRSRGRPDRARRPARPGGVVRGRRGDAHRDQRQVPPRRAWRPSWPMPGCASSGG